MGRTRGSRNADYEQQRSALARRVSHALREEGGVNASFRSLAQAAGVSVATLRHYFVDREGLLRAVMEDIRAEAAPYQAMALRPQEGDVRAVLLRFLSDVRQAWFRFGVGRTHAATLSLGLGHRGVGPSYVDHVLEPLLQTGEALLRLQVERGALVIEDVRHASLLFLSPVVLALFHQDSLSGAQCRPLELERYILTHVDVFLRAYGRPPAPVTQSFAGAGSEA